MTDEELIARLRNNPTDEEAALAATRIYNLGLLNDLAEANLEAEELTNWLKLKEAKARIERLEAALRFYADPAGDGYEVRDRSMGDPTYTFTSDHSIADIARWIISENWFDELLDIMLEELIKQEEAKLNDPARNL